VEVIVDEGVGIVTTGRADPRQSIISFLKEHGVKVMAVVPTVRHALRLEAEGVDAVVASGSEAGGHVGRVATLPLVPQVVDAVKIPVVAAGGIADARGFVAALALGACGIQMGTRFVATVECDASPQEKQRILEAGDEDSVVTEVFTGKTTRVLRSPQLDDILRALEAGVPRDEVWPQVVDLRRKKEARHPEFTSIASGQGAGLVRRIMTAEEVVREVISGAEAICRSLDLGSSIRS
jgi:enoyl-[acyl-carrier protein] reductase II